MKAFLFGFVFLFSFFLDFYVWLLVIPETRCVIGKFDEYFCDYLCTHQVLSLCSRMEFLIGFGEYVGSASLLYEKQKRSMAAVYFACVLCPPQIEEWGILFLSCLSYCHSVNLSETLTFSNNILTVSSRALIFHMSIACCYIGTKFLTLWPWPWIFIFFGKL